MKVSKKVRVGNVLGLHTRPATMIAKMLQKSQSEVTFSYREKRVDARSILHVLTLAVPERGWITVDVSGQDAEETMRALVEGFKSRFGEAEGDV